MKLSGLEMLVIGRVYYGFVQRLGGRVGDIYRDQRTEFEIRLEVVVTGVYL